MAKRVTIMLDDELASKIRRLQAKEIQRTSASFSYSKAIEEILRKQLK